MLQSVAAAIANDEMAAKVRDAARAKGRTDKWLADAMNMAEPTFNRKIRGAKYEFTPTELMEVASLLDMSPIELLPAAFFDGARCNKCALAVV